MKFRKVRLFFNRRSGPGASRFLRVQEAVSREWSTEDADIAWYFPSSREESHRMVGRALDDGTDCVIVCGGDGTVSSIGRELIGTGVPMGIVPLGSGNGLARHFGASMDPAAAVAQLACGAVRDLDVGRANGRPFLVSASVAWDAALVRAYDQLPLRGVGSYVLAGVVSFFDYMPQPIVAVVDRRETIEIDDPLLFTIGNVSGWGGGALIDPASDASDGCLELVAGRRRDAPRMLADIGAVFSTGTSSLPGVIHRSFTHLSVRRPDARPIQLDGELAELGAEIEFTVSRGEMKLLTPAGTESGPDKAGPAPMTA